MIEGSQYELLIQAIRNLMLPILVGIPVPSILTVVFILAISILHRGAILDQFLNLVNLKALLCMDLHIKFLFVMCRVVGGFVDNVGLMVILLLNEGPQLEEIGLSRHQYGGGQEVQVGSGWIHVEFMGFGG